MFVMLVLKLGKEMDAVSMENDVLQTLQFHGQIICREVTRFPRDAQSAGAQTLWLPLLPDILPG